MTGEALGKKEHLRLEVNEKLVAQDARLKYITLYKEQIQKQVDVHKVAMVDKWKEC